jgi:hypothetical protein
MSKLDKPNESLVQYQEKVGSLADPKTLFKIAREDEKGELIPLPTPQLLMHANQANNDLWQTLQDVETPVEDKRTQVAVYQQNLSEAIEGLEFLDGVRTVVKWLSALRNTSIGTDILNELEEEDLMDLTNPSLLIGVLMYHYQLTEKKDKTSDDPKILLLNKILGNYDDDGLNQQEIIALLSKIKAIEVKSLDIDNKALLTSICREFVSHTFNYSEPTLNDNMGDRDFILTIINNCPTPEILFKDLHPNTYRILNAIRDTDEEVYIEIIRELITVSVTLGGYICLNEKEEDGVLESLIIQIIEKDPSVSIIEENVIETLRGTAGLRKELPEAKTVSDLRDRISQKVGRNTAFEEEIDISTENIVSESEPITEPLPEEEDNVLDEDI